ncbi:hypothetical protein AB0C59_33970 [Streptomyces sp. NPDC048664]|uniref:hypothetical protein n=1 Tax=Streptomyces sp. NPDC048664 TaxID=3154505 RepID=UPI0034348F5B
MVVRVERQAVQGIRHIGSPHACTGIDVAGSSLTSCFLAQFDDPNFGLIVRDAWVQACTVDRCQVQGVYFDGATVDGLITKQIHGIYGCVFSRVVLKGKIGSVMVMPPHTSLAHRDLHIAGMVQKYREVEWALDISEASFMDADFYGVPGDLVKYDPETQVLLRREKLEDVPLEELPTYAEAAHDDRGIAPGSQPPSSSRTCAS